MRVGVAIVLASFSLALAYRPLHGQMPVGATSALETIHMVGAENGWGVSIEYPSGVRTLLRTTDGGIRWKSITPLSSSGQQISIGGITVFSSLIVWVSRINPNGSATSEIFRTIDGGLTWRSATIAAREVTWISFINPRDGWLIAFIDAGMGNENVDIYRSTDGGEIWIKVASARDSGGGSGLPYGDKSSITFVNPTTGWTTGLGPKPDSLYLYVTRDGGSTWRPQSLPLPSQRHQNRPIPPDMTPHWIGSAQPPKFFTVRDGIMRVGFAHYLLNDSTGDTRDTRPVVVFYVTHDSGTTWTYTTPVPVGEGDYRRPSSFADIEHGWVNEKDALFVTSDGGQRWTTMRPGKFFTEVTQLDFVSPQVGWVVRQRSQHLLKTVDGGRTWSPVPYTILR